MAFSTHDIVPDSPTNNFCTLNPLNKGDNATLSEGNLKCVTSQSGQTIGISTVGVSTGKWYMEGKTDVLYLNIGIIAESIAQSVGSLNFLGGQSNSWCYAVDGNIYNNGSAILNTGTTYSTSDVVGLLLDLDSGNMYVFKNGNPVYSGNAVVTGLSGTYYLGVGAGDSTKYVNFGQDPTFGGATNLPTGAGDYDTDAAGNSTGGRFAFQPPTGALALCSANLPEMTPDVADDVPQDYFKTVTYTGQNADSTFIDNGDNTWSKTGVGFQPDLIWAKSRSSATSHALADSVRGPRKILSSNSTADEYSETSGKTLLSFDSDGFTVGTDGNYTAFTANNSSIVAWCWKAGGAPSGSTSTTGSAKRINTSGTQDDTSCSALATAATNAGASNVITPTLMSINQAAGFSITKFTSPSTVGTDFTVPHGLSSAPDIVIQKETDSTGEWVIYHSSVVDYTNKLLYLSKTDKLSTYAGYSFWGSHLVDENAVGFRSTSSFNEGSEVMMYCWHSVEGYSKFSSYTGNGSTDGPFVYCGFRPAFVMYKNIDASANVYSSWGMIDSSRSSYNPTGGPETLWANRSTQEGYRGNGTTLIGANDFLNVDFLSNGFKLRGSGGNTETNDAQVYIFMAFAEQPFKYANAR